MAAGLPTIGMGFALGRLLLASFARTAAECPVLYYQGDMDQVRLWSHARSPALIQAEAVRDTLALPLPAALVGYWPFDDPIDRGVCAQSLPGVRDMVTGTASPLLRGARVVQALAGDLLPIDEEPVLALYLHHVPFPLSVERPHNRSAASGYASNGSHSHAGGSDSGGGGAFEGVGEGASGVTSELAGDETITVYLGDTLQLDAHLSDANPSDQVRSTLNTKNKILNPSDLVRSTLNTKTKILNPSDLVRSTLHPKNKILNPSDLVRSALNPKP